MARRRRRSRRAERELNLPPSLQTTFQGNAQAFQQSLSTVPMLIGAALVVVYLILGILYESYIHPHHDPVDSAVGRCRCARRPCMLFGFDFSLVAMIGVILLIGIVKKNGIMLVDFALVAEREEHLSTEEAIHKAALLRFRPIMMTTMAALLGAVPLMLGTGMGAEIRQPLGYAMVGGLVAQPGDDAVHDADHLHLPRQALEPVRRPGAAARAAAAQPAE